MGVSASKPTCRDSLLAADDSTHFVPDPKRTRRSGLRLLCLHGHGSNNDITTMQITHTMMREVHGVSCDMYEATLEASAHNELFYMFSERPFYTWFHHWWFITGTSGIGRRGGSLHHSLQRVIAIIEAHGPYDAIYGFSQGAFMAACICNQTVWKGLCGLDRCPVRGAILANSALANTLRSVEIAQADVRQVGTTSCSGKCLGCSLCTNAHARMTLPVGREVASLHLIGECDWWRSASEAMATTFERSESYVHAHGHELPMALKNDAALTASLHRFFNGLRLQ